MKHPVLVCFACGLAALASASGLVAQGASERDLLNELDQPRTAFAASLDLAALYRDQGRRTEALHMLEIATGILSAERRGLVAGPAPPPPPLGVPLRVGGDILEPRKTRNVFPPYPESARAAHLYGAVMVELVIDPAGAVSAVRVLRSCPPFDAAAVQAVKQWRFERTLLGGQAVSVMTTAVVGFWP